jgi:hypothetical protein
MDATIARRLPPDRRHRQEHTMKSLDFPKQDMAFDYGERSFALRAYRSDGSWHSVIIENKTPLRNTLPPTADAAKCFAEAMAFVTAVVDAAGRAQVAKSSD